MTDQTHRKLPLWLAVTSLAGLAAIAVIWLAAVPRPPGHPEALHQAVRTGDVTAVQHQLKRRADVNAPDAEFGATPLHAAAAQGHTQIARLLLASGAHPDAVMERTGYTPLYWAVENGHAETVGALLEGGCDPDARGPQRMSPLHLAAAQGDLDVVKLLLAHGADVEARERFGGTPLNGLAVVHPEVVELLLASGADPMSRAQDGRTAVHRAAFFVGTTKRARPSLRDLEAAERSLNLLLQAGGDINARDDTGRTPVFASMVEGGHEGVAYLATLGADLHACANDGRTPLHDAAASALVIVGDSRVGLAEHLLGLGLEVDAADINGMTPLHLAAWRANRTLIEFLVARGADLHRAADSGANAIYFAAQESSPPTPGPDRVTTVHYLIEQGVTSHVVTDAGNTPLHMAARFGNAAVAELLLEQGLDPNRPNNAGETPIDLALREGFAELARMLQAGNDVQPEGPAAADGVRERCVRAGPRDRNSP